MNQKTAHELARELLAGPDLPIYHFDPSRAGMDDEADTSISAVVVEVVEPDAERGITAPFITICGDYDLREEMDLYAEMAKARKLRPALVGLVGCDGEAELRGLLATMHEMPAPADDKAVSLAAISALIDTLPSSPANTEEGA